MRRALTLVAVTTLLLGACGSDGSSDSVDAGARTEDSTTVPEPTTTVAESTTTSEPPEEVTTTTDLSDLPGEPIDLYAREGAELGVVGVDADDVLNLRTGPGADFDVVAELEPTAEGLIATGNNRSVPNGIWYQVEFDGEIGWVNARYTAYLGSTADLTGELPGDLTAPTPDDLARRIAEARGFDEPGSEGPDPEIVIVDRPEGGREDPIVVDIVGLADDSVTGERLRIGLRPVSGGGVGWDRVEATVLCTRGLSDDGICV